MKKLLFLVVFMYVPLAFAQAQGGDNDTVWTKSLWNYGQEIVRAKFIYDKTIPNGENIALGIGDRVQIYNAKNGSFVKEFSKYMKGIIDFDFSENEKYLVTTSSDKNIIIWDYEKNDTVRIINANEINSGIRFINNNLIIGRTNSASATNYLNVWDISTGQKVNSVTINGLILLFTLNKQGNRIALNVGTSNSPHMTIQLWDLNTVSYLSTIYSQDEHISDICFSPDGRFLAVADYNFTVKIIDINTQKLIKTLIHYDNQSSQFFKIAFSPNGRYLISSGGYWTQIFTKIWDLNNFTEVYKYNPPYASTNGLEINQDSSKICISNAYDLYVLKTPWGKTSVLNIDNNKIDIIYPNPAGSQVTVPLEPIAINSIKIIDNMGNLVKNIVNISPLTTNINIDITDVHSGAYIINILYQSKTSSYKFIKIR